MAQLKQMINKNKFYIIGTLILFLFLFYCSTKLCMNVAPDEYMRYDMQYGDFLMDLHLIFLQ